MQNVEISARVIAAILHKLMEVGLQETLLDDRELGLDDEQRKFAGTCFDWLESEGIVRCKNTAHSAEGAAWIDPVLTSRGFAVLGTKLEYDGDTMTVAEFVETKRESGGNYSAIGDFLGGAFGGLIKSMGS